jgi:hypothetical protein
MYAATGICGDRALTVLLTRPTELEGSQFRVQLPRQFPYCHGLRRRDGGVSYFNERQAGRCCALHWNIIPGKGKPRVWKSGLRRPAKLNLAWKLVFIQRSTSPFECQGTPAHMGLRARSVRYARNRADYPNPDYS